MFSVQQSLVKQISSNIFVLPRNSLQAASLRKEIRRLEDRKRRMATKDKQWGLTTLQMVTTVAVYVLSSYDVGAATGYARAVRRRSQKDMAEATWGEPPIEDWFLATPMHDVLGFSYPETTTQRKAHKSATSFLAEQRVVHWVAEQNFHAGVAPTGADVAAEFLRRQSSEGAALHSGLSQSLDKRGRWQRRWAQKFRLRWGLKKQRLPSRESLADVDLQKKVLRRMFWFIFAGPFFRLIVDPFLGTLFRHKQFFIFFVGGAVFGDMKWLSFGPSVFCS